MKVTTDSTTATVRRVVRIQDGPVIHPDGYRRRYRVDTVVVDYTWKDGSFVIEGTFSIHLAGQWVKKDGTDALDRATGMLVSHVSYTSRELEAQYKFLIPLINELRPNGDLSMMILKDHEL